MPKNKTLATPGYVHHLWRLLATCGHVMTVEQCCEQLSLPRPAIIAKIAKVQDFMDRQHQQDRSKPSHWQLIPKSAALMAVLREVQRTGVVPTNVTLMPARSESKTTTYMTLEEMR